MKVIPCEYVPDYRWVKRSFFERYFTWPWTPWVRFKATTTPYVLVIRDTAWVSFGTFEKMRRGNFLL